MGVLENGEKGSHQTHKLPAVLGNWSQRYKCVIMVPSHARIPLIPYPALPNPYAPTSNYHDNNLVGGFNLRRKAIWGELPLPGCLSHCQLWSPSLWVLSS